MIFLLCVQKFFFLLSLELLFSSLNRLFAVNLTHIHLSPLILEGAMPKVKRFRNPLKSVRAPSDAHEHSSPTTNPTQSHAIGSSTSVHSPPHVIGPSTSEQVFPHDASSPSLADEVESQEQAPTQSSNSNTTSKNEPHWKVETIDSQKAIKTTKVKVNDVNNLPLGERIIVDFNEYGSAIGASQGLLAGYCGTLAIDCNLFPISFDRWLGPAGVPNKYKEECFDNVLKPRFYFRTSEANAYRYCNSSIGKKWSTHRLRTWDEFSDPAKSTNELLSNVPIGINKDQWASYVAYRKRPATIELCKRNKENRSKQTIPHTGGSKPLARRRHEIFLATGAYPSRGQLYIETHKKKSGSFVNEEARIIGDQIQLNMTQHNESEVSPNDIIGKLFGPEHSGRVRCLGMGAAPSNTFKNAKRLTNLNVSSSNLATSSSSSTDTYLHQKVSRLEYQLGGTLDALKNYMISKEGSIPEEFVGLFAPQSQPTDATSEPTSPVDVRGSSGGSNVDRQDNTK